MGVKDHSNCMAVKASQVLSHSLSSIIHRNIQKQVLQDCEFIYKYVPKDAQWEKLRPSASKVSWHLYRDTFILTFIDGTDLLLSSMRGMWYRLEQDGNWLRPEIASQEEECIPKMT